MPKFHIRLKLQGLELEVDGERADIPLITAAVQKQLAGLVQPAEAFTDGNKTPEPQTIEVEAKASRRSGKKRSGGSDRGGETGQAIEFRHDPEKYGNPQQDWSVTEKCIWLLQVLSDATEVKEVSAPQITQSFNRQFKAAGKLHPPLVSRELARAKVENPALIGEDKDLWYLTSAGQDRAKELISKTLNPSNS